MLASQELPSEKLKKHCGLACQARQTNYRNDGVQTKDVRWGHRL